MEIGSEFWLEDASYQAQDSIPNWISKLGYAVLTSSGRGALSLLLQQVTPRYKSVLLPAYICESVITPFVEQGYTCFFYEVGYDLSPKIESIKSYNKIGMFVHMGYFGFSTNEKIQSVIEFFKEMSTIIVEDITHSLFRKTPKIIENDFYVGSIRKWFGIPGGGVLGSQNISISPPELTNECFTEIRKEALLTKAMYFKSGDKIMKGRYLQQFSVAESLLDEDHKPYCIDSISMNVISMLEVDELVNKRRENYVDLFEGIKDIHWLKSPFGELPDDVCPMFFPILVNKNLRDYIRIKLTDEKIFCPIHWPISSKINETKMKSVLEIYNNILSIPCDQRYGKTDMERIISVMKKIQ